MVTRRGEEVVIVLSKQAYEDLRRTETGLVEFFRNSPLVGVELESGARPQPPREVAL